MLAYQQNNVSRALAGVAGTIGQYAQAAHEDRINQAKMQFEQMLENNRMKQTQANHDADKAQQESQFNTTSALSEKRLDAQDKHQTQVDAESTRYHNIEASNDSARTSMEGARTQAEVDKLHSDQTDAITTRQTQILNTRLASLERQSDYATGRRDSALQKLQADPNYAIAKPEQQQAMQDAATKPWDTILSHNQTQTDQVQQAFQRISPVSGNDSGTPGSSGSPAPSSSTPTGPSGKPAVKYDAQGNAWTLGPDGKPIPYNPSADTGGGLPGSSSSTDPSQTDPSSTAALPDPTTGAPDPSTAVPALAGAIDPSAAPAAPTDPSAGAPQLAATDPASSGTDPSTLGGLGGLTPLPTLGAPPTDDDTTA